MSDNMTLFIHLLIKMGLISKNYYGKLTLTFEHGKLVNGDKKDSIDVKSL